MTQAGIVCMGGVAQKKEYLARHRFVVWFSNFTEHTTQSCYHMIINNDDDDDNNNNNNNNSTLADSNISASADCILSWRRSWDGGVQKTSQVRRIVRVVRVPADCFGNFWPNQRIGCAILKRSAWATESLLSLPMIRRHNFSFRDSLSLCRDFTLSCCMSRLEVMSTRTFSRPAFLTCLAFNPRDLYYWVY